MPAFMFIGGSAVVAPTYFGSASNPADNGTLGAANVTVTPPASMQAGDLVAVFCHERSGSAEGWTVGVTGGQSWTSETELILTTNCDVRVIWCTFNGTWAADPRFDNPGGFGISAVMHVFRPDTTSRVWSIDTAQAAANVAAPSTPFTVSRAGLTTTSARTATVAAWFTGDDNTWDTLTGTGWVVTGDAQYRNLSGSDISSSYAHYLAAAAGTVIPTTAKNQATNGGDATTTLIISWKFA